MATVWNISSVAFLADAALSEILIVEGPLGAIMVCGVPASASHLAAELGVLAFKQVRQMV